MNKKAEELGLTNTHFVTPHGLDAPKHYTTAYELAKLTDYALNNTTFAKLVSTKTTTVDMGGYPKAISNTNELLGNLNGVNGVKTGFTNNALRCLVTSVDRGDLELITVVLGADTRKIRTKDSTSLIEYSYKNFESVDLDKIAEKEFEKWQEKNTDYTYVNKGIKNNVDLQLCLENNYETGQNTNIVPIKKDEIKDITTEIIVASYREAPLNNGENNGILLVKLNDDILTEYEITIAENINRKGIFDYLTQMISNYNRILENY